METPLHKRLRLSAFVFGLWLLSLFGWKLASALRSCYFWFRYIDDIIDRDLPYAGDINMFRQEKKTLLQIMNNNGKLAELSLEAMDWMIVHVYREGKKFGYDSQQSMITLYEALEYDIDRTEQKRMYYSRAEIREYFDKLDIPSVVMTFQFINEKAITLEDLQPLIDATRERYNVRDFIQDLAVGIVNIPTEDIEYYGIDIQILLTVRDLREACEHLPFKKWFKGQCDYIEERLKAGRHMMKAKPIRVRTWLALWTCFTRPCEANLRKWKPILA